MSTHQKVLNYAKTKLFFFLPLAKNITTENFINFHKTLGITGRFGYFVFAYFA